MVYERPARWWNVVAWDVVDQRLGDVRAGKSRP